MSGSPQKLIVPIEPLRSCLTDLEMERFAKWIENCDFPALPKARLAYAYVFTLHPSGAATDGWPVGIARQRWHMP